MSSIRRCPPAALVFLVPLVPLVLALVRLVLLSVGFPSILRALVPSDSSSPHCRKHRSPARVPAQRPPPVQARLGRPDPPDQDRGDHERRGDQGQRGDHGRPADQHPEAGGRPVLAPDVDRPGDPGDQQQPPRTIAATDQPFGLRALPQRGAAAAVGRARDGVADPDRGVGPAGPRLAEGASDPALDPACGALGPVARLAPRRAHALARLLQRIHARQASGIDPGCAVAPGSPQVIPGDCREL